MRKSLTELVVRSAKPKGESYTIWDQSMPGFGLRIMHGGRKTWTLMRGKERKRT